MHTWCHPNDSGEFLSRDDADRTRYLLYPKQADYQFSLIPLYFINYFQSYHNHVYMSIFAYINPWYEPMSGNAPESMLYENTVLLLNYTGIDAHAVKQHGSSIMISCARIHPCRDDIVPWMEFESMTFWFGIKCSIHWAIRTKSGEQDWTLPAMNEEMETFVCILLVHTTSSVINRLIKPPRAIHIPFPDVGSAIAITTCSDQPTCDRALDRNCTCDPELRRFLLYLLSYKGGILSSFHVSINLTISMIAHEHNDVKSWIHAMRKYANSHWLQRWLYPVQFLFCDLFHEWTHWIHTNA